MQNASTDLGYVATAVTFLRIIDFLGDASADLRDAATDYYKFLFKERPNFEPF